MHFMRVGSNRCKYILRGKMRDIRVNVRMESFFFLSSSVCYIRFFNFSPVHEVVFFRSRCKLTSDLLLASTISRFLFFIPCHFFRR